MTKSVLVTLVLIGLSLGIMWIWFFDRPSTDPVSMGAGFEQTRDAAVDSSVPSRPLGRQVALKSSAVSPVSPVRPAGDSSERAASGPRLLQPKRGQRQDSAFRDDEQAEGLAISGLVQDEEGFPLANIEVLAEPIRPPNADKLTGDSALEAARSSWTDFDGSFVFGNLSEDEYRIRVAPIDGFAAAETKARVGVKSANLVLEWLRFIRVYGIVSSTEGKPLEGVRVIAGPPTRVTDSGPKGHYELDIVMKEKSSLQTIHFRRDGFRDQSNQLAPADLDGVFDEIPLDVSMEQLKDLTTVTGRLEDLDGRPVVGKLLNLKSPKLRTRYRAQSDSRGFFSMDGVEPGKDYQLSVRPGADYRDYERAQLEIPASGLKFNVVLEPLGEGELSGWMTDAGGRPIPGFALTLSSKAAAGQSVQVVGDHQGFFMVEGFPEGGVVLKTNSYPVFETQGISASHEVDEPVSVVLDMGPHAIHGRVTNIFGDTLAAPEVSLGWQLNVNGARNYSARKTIADLNGNFVFTGLGSGVHTLRVNAPGFSMAVINVNIGTDPDNIVVELNEGS